MKKQPMIEGWLIDKRDVQKIADKMDWEENISLPDVVVVGKESNEGMQVRPMLYEVYKKDDPSGYTITVPELMLKDANINNYTVGHRAEENIRHELAHYLEHKELGTRTGTEEDDPYSKACKELRADIRAKRRSLSRCIAIVTRTLVNDYGLDVGEAYNVVARAAKDLGVGDKTIKSAKQWYEDDRICYL
jgi:hypothetical protein